MVSEFLGWDTDRVAKSKYSKARREKKRKEEKMPATKVKQRRTTKKSRMTIGDIRNKAQKLGITPGKMNKTELIHTIQTWEGYTPCFGQSNGECGNIGCCFMAECLKTKL